MPDILISEVMTSSVCSISPNEKIAKVVEIMRQRLFSCLVVKENDKAIGIITERDILRLTNLLLNGSSPDNLVAKTVMTSPTISIQESANVMEAIMICQERKIRHLPVVNHDGKLCGLLTQSDLLAAYAQTLEKTKINLEAQIKEREKLLEDASIRVPPINAISPQIVSH